MGQLAQAGAYVSVQPVVSAALCGQDCEAAARLSRKGQGVPAVRPGHEERTPDLDILKLPGVLLATALLKSQGAV